MKRADGMTCPDFMGQEKVTVKLWSMKYHEGDMHVVMLLKGNWSLILSNRGKCWHQKMTKSSKSTWINTEIDVKGS